MSDLFVPPPKTLTPPELPPADDLTPIDPAPLEAEAMPLANPAPIGVDEGDSASAGNTTGSVPEASALSTRDALVLEDQALSLPAMDTVFFYGRSAADSLTLYEVNLEEGGLTAASAPKTLFSTAIDGLFTAQPGGLGGPGEATDPLVAPAFALSEGTSGKNFLIGTVDDEALLAYGGGDLILTGQGRNLAFGGAGNDTLVGGIGDNGLFGGAGNDAIEGDGGDDLLVGGSGDDILYGGAGANTLMGGTGADIFRLNSPGAYGLLVGSTSTAETDTILDFNAAEGDLLDLSLIAGQPLFDRIDLLPFLSFVQVGADTHVQVTTPLGQTSTEAILVGIDADSMTPANLTFTPPSGVPLLK